MNIQKPYSQEHTYTQHLSAPPAQVFPLLCPVREAKWVPDWEPRLVISNSGVNEEDCIFVMPDDPHDAIWVVTEWNPVTYVVKFVKVMPGKAVCRIAMQLTAGPGNSTCAEITYSYTALSEAGKKLVDGFTAEHYEKFIMFEWEHALNHFLTTGKMVSG